MERLQTSWGHFCFWRQETWKQIWSAFYLNVCRKKSPPDSQIWSRSYNYFHLTSRNKRNVHRFSMITSAAFGIDIIYMTHTCTYWLIFYSREVLDLKEEKGDDQLNNFTQILNNIRRRHLDTVIPYFLVNKNNINTLFPRCPKWQRRYSKCKQWTLLR